MTEIKKYSDLTDGEKQELTLSGIAFLRAISKAYGSEVGSETLMTLTKSLPGVGDSIWMEMLGARQFNAFTATCSSITNKISIIKLIRQHTIYKSLIDAKKVSDVFVPGTRVFTIDEMDAASEDSLNFFKNQLINNGVYVH